MFVDPFSDPDPAEPTTVNADAATAVPSVAPAADDRPAEPAANPFANLTQASDPQPTPPATLQSTMPSSSVETPLAAAAPAGDFSDLFNDAPAPAPSTEPASAAVTVPVTAPVAVADPFTSAAALEPLPSSDRAGASATSFPVTSPGPAFSSPTDDHTASYVVSGPTAEKLADLARETGKDPDELLATALDLIVVLRRLP